jgi:LacI family transcriptional regulator
MLKRKAMAKERCTVDDVAREAGVSSMTVSRAMNDMPGLSAETRERVLEAARRLGYKPNRIARALASRKSASLGIVLPDMANPFFAILAKAATDVARSAGKSVFIMNTDEDPELEEAALDCLRCEDIAGVVIAGSRLPEARLLAVAADFRSAVLVNRDCSGPGLGCVNVEDREGAAEAVAYLASTGRRRIGLIAGPRIAVGARRRLDGYRDGLERGGLAFDRDIVAECVPTIEGGERATRELVARAPGIDAILAYNDLAAIGVLRALEESGRSVPRDVAVMGTDDMPYAALVKPALSTVRADIPLLGASAMRLLLELDERGEAPPVQPQSPVLVIREST